jgi:hypothetical protein
MQPHLLHPGYEIDTHFFLLTIWAFRHSSIIQIEYSFVGVKKEFVSYLHPYLIPISLDSLFHPDHCDTYHF